MSAKRLLILSVKMIHFCRFVMGELIKLAKMAGVRHEADTLPRTTGDYID